MTQIELLRRYPFFAGFNRDQLESLARVAKEIGIEADHLFISEGERVSKFYLVLEGMVGITIKVPDREFEQSLSRQITKDLITKDITVSTLSDGEVFGWSALIPPNQSTASAKALTPCRVLEFDFQALQPLIAEDCCFGHLLTLKAAQIIRQRFRDMRVERLAELEI